MSLLSLTVCALLGATLPHAGETAAPAGERMPSSGPTLALAQDSGGQGQDREPRRKMRVIRLEELKIEGRIQKPQAFYLLQRSNLNFDDLNREESFLDKVVEAVEKPPF